ncbi:unnamed protein product, partial [Amoebophrya sp. A120]
RHGQKLKEIRYLSPGMPPGSTISSTQPRQSSKTKPQRFPSLRLPPAEYRAPATQDEKLKIHLNLSDNGLDTIAKLATTLNHVPVGHIEYLDLSRNNWSQHGLDRQLVPFLQDVFVHLPSGAPFSSSSTNPARPGINNVSVVSSTHSQLLQLEHSQTQADNADQERTRTVRRRKAKLCSLKALNLSGNNGLSIFGAANSNSRTRKPSTPAAPSDAVQMSERASSHQSRPKPPDITPLLSSLVELNLSGCSLSGGFFRQLCDSLCGGFVSSRDETSSVATTPSQLRKLDLSYNRNLLDNPRAAKNFGITLSRNFSLVELKLLHTGVCLQDLVAGFGDNGETRVSKWDLGKNANLGVDDMRAFCALLVRSFGCTSGGSSAGSGALEQAVDRATIQLEGHGTSGGDVLETIRDVDQGESPRREALPQLPRREVSLGLSDLTIDSESHAFLGETLYQLTATSRASDRSSTAAALPAAQVIAPLSLSLDLTRCRIRGSEWDFASDGPLSSLCGGCSRASET